MPDASFPRDMAKVGHFSDAKCDMVKKRLDTPDPAANRNL
jgi:hypothetical protein